MKRRGGFWQLSCSLSTAWLRLRLPGTSCVKVKGGLVPRDLALPGHLTLGLLSPSVVVDVGVCFLFAELNSASFRVSEHVLPVGTVVPMRK